MTYAEFHAAIRDALRRTDYEMMVAGVRSFEGAGRVSLSWSVFVTSSRGNAGDICLVGPDPHKLLAELRESIYGARPTDPAPPPVLGDIGTPSDVMSLAGESR